MYVSVCIVYCILGLSGSIHVLCTIHTSTFCYYYYNVGLLVTWDMVVAMKIKLLMLYVKQLNNVIVYNRSLLYTH